MENKPEPLKREDIFEIPSECYKQEIRKGKTVIKVILLEKHKSAVEWLKEQLPVFPSGWKKWTPAKVRELIDEAFVDVVDKKEKGD